LHVHDPLAGGQQLLRQQPTQASRALDRPHSIRPRPSPPLQAQQLIRTRRHPNLAKDHLPGVEHHRSVRPLVRIDPDHHTSHNASLSRPMGNDRDGQV
jgi:hypothetical protein